MIKYNLKKMAGPKPKGTKVLFGPIEAPLSLELRYRKLLNSILAAMAKEVRASILPAVQADRAQIRRAVAQSRVFGDAPDDSWFSQLKALTDQLVESSRPIVEDIFTLEAKKHDEDFMAQAKKTLGIDLKAVIQQEDLEEHIKMVTAKNVGLIKSLTDEAYGKIQQAVYNNASGGGTFKDLKDELTKTFNMSGRRAKIIARDQIAKFNSSLDEVRQRQAGIEEYDWSTSHDERVRPLHKRLDGKRYKWGEKTGAESGLPPGQPILCRCVALAVIEWDEAKSIEPPIKFIEPAEEVTPAKPQMSEAKKAALAKAHAAVKAKAAANKAIKEAEKAAKEAEKAAAALAKEEAKAAAALAKKKAQEQAKIETVGTPSPDLVESSLPAWPSLTADEKAAVKAYKGSSYRSINENLRAGNKPTARDKHIDAAIAKTAPMGNGIKLYRGFISAEMASAARANPDAMIGMEIKDLGFISTSYDVNVSINFSKNYPNSGVLLRIAPKPGLKALPIDNIGINSSEKELLIARGTAMKIRAVSEFNGLVVLDVEIDP